MTNGPALPWDTVARCRPFPLPPPGSVGPPEEYAWLREQCPVARVQLPVGVPGWFVTRHADVRALLADRRLVRPAIDDWPEPAGGPRAEPGLVTMMEMGGEPHKALRAAVAGAFSARAVRGRRERIRQLADRVLDEFERGKRPADVVTGYAEPFPLLVLCDLVGLPHDERHLFLEPADAALGAMNTLAEGRRATRVLRCYLGELVQRKRAEPADDVLTDLVRRCDGGELDDEQVINFGLSVLIAGYRTSTMFLANAVLHLLRHPDRLALLHEDRDLLPRAAEEMFRFLPVMNGNVLLTATTSLEVAGTVIRAGDGVVPSVAAANRDGSVFDRPDDLCLGRGRNPHLAFGRGEHNCIGAHLARAELEIGLGALLDRFPGLRLAASENEIPWEDHAPAKSPLRLPVNW